MLVFGWLYKIYLIFGAASLLKDPICGLENSKNGLYGRECRAPTEVYSYNADTNECVYFVYGGCGGNANRFKTIEDCEEKCKV